MIVSGISEATLVRAAHIVGVTAKIRLLNQRGDRFQVKINLDRSDGRWTSGRLGDVRFQKYGHNRNKKTGLRWRTGSVCWHGFRDFFRACFAESPGAIFRTSLDVWKGAEDFESRFERSAEKNIGSVASPLCFADACGCEHDEGIENRPDKTAGWGDLSALKNRFKTEGVDVQAGKGLPFSTPNPFSVRS